MATLPTIMPGLKPQRMKPPAVFTGIMTSLLALPLCAATVVAVPRMSELMSTSGWLHHLQVTAAQIPHAISQRRRPVGEEGHLACAVPESSIQVGDPQHTCCSSPRAWQIKPYPFLRPSDDPSGR